MLTKVTIRNFKRFRDEKRREAMAQCIEDLVPRAAQHYHTLARHVLPDRLDPEVTTLLDFVIQVAGHASPAPPPGR